jgi:hypothetical protein
MRYAPKKEKSAWRERALAAANNADLGDLISLCEKAKEWDQLAKHLPPCARANDIGWAYGQPALEPSYSRLLGLRIEARDKPAGAC